MKITTTFLFVLFSTSSFAISTSKLIKACQEVGTAKVVAQAEAYGLKVNPKDVKECGVDNRFMNPSKYVWFCAVTTGGEKKISSMTQKPAFKDCF